MKKFNLLAVMAVVLTLFSACQQEELDVNEPQIAGANKNTPDVYAENGYMAFKDLLVLDSVLNVLSDMTREQQLQWELSYNFISVNTSLQPLFEKSEQLKTEEEWAEFKASNLETLKWEDDYSFDYPFVHTSLVPVLNKDGMVKIGQSLYKYNKENKIVVLDGDYSKLAQAVKTNESSDNVIVFGKEGTLKAASENMITDFKDDYTDFNTDGDFIEWSSSRRMRNRLYCERFTYRTESGMWHGGYRINLYQQAQKKGIFGWKNYYTKYSVQNIYYKENGAIKVNDSGKHYSAEVKPSRSFNVWTQITDASFFEIPLSSISRPSPINFSCGSSCRGFDYYPIFIDYQD